MATSYMPTPAEASRTTATSIELVKAHSTASLNPKVKCVVVADTNDTSASIRRPSAFSRRRVSVISK